MLKRGTKFVAVLLVIFSATFLNYFLLFGSLNVECPNCMTCINIIIIILSVLT
jgi:hypothetical protein